ncbi:response regulator [Cohnella silvisoli]|uniref:Response regulator n=1 Tax=Cohnella silvisoli TaxID=2873699 RepID=A0ABV1KTZ1_9BACL|nr:response regulator [Cohnella silvisoli]
MYRLLIVDDEQDIVEGLFELFRSFDSFDLDVYKAFSGGEAVEWMRKTKIDIVLTDIRMPGLSGLQLMEVIRAHWPECQIIFLTGYNEFDYVYAAIKNTSVSYLLKMEGHEEIVNAVRNAIIKIIENRKIDDLISNANKQLNTALPIIQKEYFMELLSGNPIKFDQIDEHFEQLGIPLDPQSPVIMISCKVNHPSKDISLLNRVKWVQSIHMVFEKYLKRIVQSYYIEYEKLKIIWLAQPYKGSDQETVETETILNSIRGNLESVQEVCYESLGVSLSFVIDHKYSDWPSIPAKFQSISEALRYCTDKGIEMKLLTSKEIISDTNNDISIVQELFRKQRQLENDLESGQEEAFQTSVHPFLLYLRDQKTKDFRPAFEVYYSVSLVLSSYINRRDLANELELHIDLKKLTRADGHGTWTDAADYLVALAKLVFEAQNDEEEDRAKTVIHKVQKYIMNHLGEEISLSKLSEIVYLNPSYLSRLFKQITGENLFSYINNRRLDKAKELLGDHQYKIHEIAAMVGFSTAPYFTRFFKKLMAISPQEYRDKSKNKSKN